MSEEKPGRIKFSQILGFFLMFLLASVFAVPIILAFMSSLKTNGEILKNPIALPIRFNLENFEFLFTRTKILRAILHTAILTVASEALIILVVPMSSYAIVRRPSKITAAIYLFFVGGMMIPFQSYMIALFRELNTIGLFGTFIGAVIIYVSGAIAFGTLLYVSFIRTTVPAEIEEAARIDGASAFQVFWRIVFPLLSPCTASLVVLNGLGIWNDFLMPSLMLSGKNPVTLNVEIFKYVGVYKTQWNVVFAGAVICIIPAIIVFLALQKYFIKGIAAGAVKG